MMRGVLMVVYLIVYCYTIAVVRGSNRKPAQLAIVKQTLNKLNSNSLSANNIKRKDSLSDQRPVIQSNNTLALNAIELCLCGALATSCGDLSLHPIDTIKIMQQSSDEALSIVAAIHKIYDSGGLAGFYNGIIPYLLGDGLSGAVKFSVFELSRKKLEKKLPVKYYSPIQFLCGALAMFACSVILVPGEVLKTKIQTGMAHSLTEAVQEIMKTEGIAGFFVGYAAMLVRDIPYTMIELGFYESIKAPVKRVRSYLTSSVKVGGGSDIVVDGESVSADDLIAAAITGVVAAVMTAPLDLIKTRMMMQTSISGEYAGVLDALTSVFHDGGIQALFAGSTARIAWLLPFTVIQLGVYEKARKVLLARKTSKARQDIS